jgi:cytochrome c oxidase subunit 4
MDTKPHIVAYGTFVAVWAALVALTGLTIWVAGLKLGNLSTTAAVLIASVKAALVVFVFMHLKYEGWLLKVMALVCLATLTTIILLTFTDVWYR